MKTFKGNHNIESAFANFIEVVEQETGIKLTDVDCYAHRPDDNTVSSALEIEGASVCGSFIKVADSENYVWGLATLELTVFPDDEQGHLLEEDPFVQCHICDEDTASDELDTRFSSDTCRPCGDKQMDEWEREDLQQQHDYRSSVL